MERFIPYLRSLPKAMVSLPQLPTVNPPKGIEASVVDCYCPLLTLVYYLEGESFINSLIADMEHPSKDIREEEAGLETGQISFTRSLRWLRRRPRVSSLLISWSTSISPT